MDVKLFIESQNCVWVKRAQNLNDNWKLRLYRGSNGSIFNIRANNYNKNTEPILYNIVKNFEKFIWGHTKVNENFRKTIIFENPIIFFEGNDRRLLTGDFFSNEIIIRHGQKVKNLTVDSLIRREGELVTYEEFCAEQQMVVPENKFRIISGACRNLEIRLGKTEADQKKSESIPETCNRIKKLSRIIRRIWEKENHVTEIPHNIRKYSDNTEIIINGDDSKTLNDLWGYNFWDNSIRTFIFKLHNNTLGYNYMVTKHVPNVNKDCTFCELNRVGEESTETPLHLFFTCPYVEPIVEEIYRWIYNEVEGNFISRQDFFGVPKRENINDNKFLLVYNILVKKYFWDCKLRLTRPNTNDLRSFLIRNINLYGKVSNKFMNIIVRSSFYVLLARHLE